MAETAAQKRIGKLPLGVARNHYNGFMPRRHLMIDLPDDERPVLQNIQEVVLSVRIGLIDLIEQQHPPVIGKKRSADRSKTKVIPDIVYVPARFTASKPRIIEPEYSIIDIAQLFAFEGGLADGLLPC